MTGTARQPYRPRAGAPPEEPRPCDLCAWSRHCALNETACRTFADWVRDGRCDTKAERKPTRRQFKALFG